MSNPNAPFDQRIKQIERKRDRLAKGSVKGMTSSGLIIERPRRYRPKFPLRAILILLIATFAIKGYFYASIGTNGYAARVAELAQGSTLDRAGAWVLQADPITIFVGDMITRYVL